MHRASVETSKRCFDKREWLEISFRYTTVDERVVLWFLKFRKAPKARSTYFNFDDRFVFGDVSGSPLVLAL